MDLNFQKCLIYNFCDLSLFLLNHKNISEIKKIDKPQKFLLGTKKD